MTTTPRTDAVATHLRTRSEFVKTDHEIWVEHSSILERELEEAKQRISSLQSELDSVNEKWMR
jgi:hypothetical protein